MKVDILKSFKGSPDGRFAVQYTEGEKNVEMTDSLYKTALAEKWVKPSKGEAKQQDLLEKEDAAAKLTDRIKFLQEECLMLEDKGKVALAEDPSGKKSKPIEAAWKEKQAELAKLKGQLENLLK